MTKQLTTDLSALSTEELKSLLAAREEEENRIKAERRQAYEARREALINDLGSDAEMLYKMLSEFKTKSMTTMAGFRNELREYGDLRRGEKNKGSFEIKNDNYKIVFRSQINKSFDERAELAEEKLKEFLASFVRKRDKKMYQIILSLLERNDKTGDFDIDLINRLYKMENDFDDPRWKEALSLFKESYSPTGTAQYIAFSSKLENGQWQALPLDFAKMRANVPQEVVTE